MLDIIKADIEKLAPRELQELRRYINDIAPPAVSYQKRGKYWYGFFRYGDKVHCVYIGREFREIDPLVELDKKHSKANKRR